MLDLQWLRQLDKTTLYGLCWRTWQLLAVPVTLYLVAVRFSPAVQGYYYTFSSLIALQSFFELGLYLVVLNLAAHEWSSLSLTASGFIDGDADASSRLVSLGRFIAIYYSIAAALFIPVALVAGFVLFPNSTEIVSSWRVPWTFLTIIAALKLIVEPFCSLLEGCGQIQQLYQMRLCQAVGSGLAGWLAIYCGFELWTAVVIAGVQLGFTVWFLAWRYHNFFRSFLRPSQRGKLVWRRDIWPMQWRLACSGLVNYFATSIFNPVMFYFHGPVVAGQMGMTLQITGGVQTVALTWLSAKVPQFGRLIARRDFSRLDDVWLSAMKVSLLTYVAGATAIGLVVFVFTRFEISLVGRILSLPALAGFLVAGAVMNAGQALTAYLRAHKQEPIFVMSVVTALLIGMAVTASAYCLGPTGVAWAYCTVATSGLVWEYRIWARCRREWHAVS